MEAQVLMAKCPVSKKIFGVRIEQRDNKWCMTWAFKIKEDVAKREGFEKTRLSGDFCIAAGFPGCPYCGAQGFIQCVCTKISCYNGLEIAECAWCGNKSKTIEADYFEVTGGDY